MSVRASGDIPTILYLIPFIGAGVYSIFLWAESGVSLLLPGNVYLTVTRDPTLFVIGSLAVLLGVVLEVRSAAPDQRWPKVVSLSNTVQSLGFASLVLALLSALYANGGSLSGAAGDFIVGRYDVVFPALLFLLSYLMRVQFRFSAMLNVRFLGIVAMILVPAALYGLNKLKSTADLPVALVFLIIGLALFLWPQRKDNPKET
jgi:hypothetical protein